MRGWSHAALGRAKALKQEGAWIGRKHMRLEHSVQCREEKEMGLERPRHAGSFQPKEALGFYFM